jgi:hypothetical protein
MSIQISNEHKLLGTLLVALQEKEANHDLGSFVKIIVDNLENLIKESKSQKLTLFNRLKSICRYKECLGQILSRELYIKIDAIFKDDILSRSYYRAMCLNEELEKTVFTRRVKHTSKSGSVSNSLNVVSKTSTSADHPPSAPLSSAAAAKDTGPNLSTINQVAASALPLETRASSTATPATTSLSSSEIAALHSFPPLRNPFL